MTSLFHFCTFANCESKFKRPSKLQVHLRKHTGERPFICDEENCNKAYTSESHLRRHKKQRHEEKIKKESYKCPVENCGKDFSTVDNMKRHKKTVHRKIYLCSVCNEGFHKTYLLRSHMEEHSVELNIKCEYCSTTFKSTTEYKKHIYNHKIYTCLCGKIFHRWFAYLEHKRINHKCEQKHTCEVCNKEFATKSIYNSHLATHEDNRTVLQCPIDDCNRFYYYKRNLQEHIQTFHMKVKKPLPPSKQKVRGIIKERKPAKTLATGRKVRKDKKNFKISFKSANLAISYESEKSDGNSVEAEMSDQYIDYSELDDRCKVLNTTSDSAMKLEK